MAPIKANLATEMERNGFIVKPGETALVTGANGFIGSKVVEVLHGYGILKIRCLVRSERNIQKLNDISNSSRTGVEIFEGNLLSKEDCMQAANGVSIVYHLAAGVEKSFPGCFLNSVITTKNLIEALKKEKSLKRFVNVSSIAVYSNEEVRRGGILDESCEVDTKFVERGEAYTYGKAKQDEIILEYGKKHNMPCVFVRPGVVFGPGKAQITGRIGIDTFGVFLHLGLNNTIPLTYVDNCAEAIVLAGLVNGIEGQVFNIVDDDLPSSREFLHQYKNRVAKFLSIPIPYPVWFLFCFLWETYSKWSEGQLPLAFNRRKCSVYWKGNQYSNRKAKETLGWRPRVPMEQALERYFAYMQEFGGKRK